MTMIPGVELEDPPRDLKFEHQTLFTTDCIQFLAELITTFDCKVEKVLLQRAATKIHLDVSGDLPEFSSLTSHIRDDKEWKILPVPERLQNRHVDVGDLAPCDTERFLKALKSDAQGIQVDFDDGNCPTYSNQIKGLFNVYKAVRHHFKDAPHISEAPVLMLRPRAWNMIEHNMMVQGKEVPGALFDYGLLVYHNGKLLFENKSGPFFYLSKIESHHEARLWNDIFAWTEEKLGLRRGSIKATVLIENVLATFEMDEILYELREHTLGLNCGIWDYSASFVNKFGNHSAFLLPDRSKYVNMEKPFLRSYMELLVQTCHRRGALATGGMTAAILPSDKGSSQYHSILEKVTRLKLLEIKAGIDGFLVYDLELIKPLQELFLQHTNGKNQLDVLREDVSVTRTELLTMPSGGVTLHGLKYNIEVGILFVASWLTGKGHFIYQGQVEDSATAEISRSQVWQWVRHQVTLEDDSRMVTRGLIRDLVEEGIRVKLVDFLQSNTTKDKERLNTAISIFLEVVQKRDFPEFITTYLNLEHTFLASTAE
ncbi:malate synthase-like isoform X1 [Polypterus senegalus]|uniref:malate synthase-like isoform X1 n=1 Tax=Polypterus senegalus TaxID=55291 RepID=UPI0019647812|nr:malate synthase-like isoform X1 [Polypterus senegalus]